MNKQKKSGDCISTMLQMLALMLQFLENEMFFRGIENIFRDVNLNRSDY